MLKQCLYVVSTSTTAILILAITASHAKALDFTFSFYNISGNRTGTVSGIITGLEDNTANQAADSVVVISYPDALEGSFDNGNDAVLWSEQRNNSFTVKNGVITNASFVAQQNNGTNTDKLWLGQNRFSVNYLTLNNNSTLTYNNHGFLGATYTLITTTQSSHFKVVSDMGLNIFAVILSLYHLDRIIRK